ncbi:hypothetical protein MKX03_001231, partial [Papaver bracteatum]
VHPIDQRSELEREIGGIRKEVMKLLKKERPVWLDALILVKIFETAFLISISSVNPNTKLSKVDDMPTDDNLRQQDPVRDAEESRDRVGGVIKRNRLYSYIVLDFETLHEANWLGSAVPYNI